MKKLNPEGFEIVRGVFPSGEIERLIQEADHVAKLAGSTCVRHLRRKSEIFNQLAVSEPILHLLPTKMSPVRSILFDKTVEENWPVAWHQDLTISVEEKREIDDYGPWSIKDGVVHVQPPTELLTQMVTVRIHLDDTPRSNGALRVIPGSFAEGKIPAAEVKSHVHKPSVICECKAGDILLMSPLILHASKRSEFPERRRIIHFEYAPYDSLDGRLSWYENQSNKPEFRTFA